MQPAYATYAIPMSVGPQEWRKVIGSEPLSFLLLL